jgi:hypothetical protein
LAPARWIIESRRIAVAAMLCATGAHADQNLVDATRFLTSARCEGRIRHCRPGARRPNNQPSTLAKAPGRVVNAPFQLASSRRPRACRVAAVHCHRVWAQARRCNPEERAIGAIAFRVDRYGSQSPNATSVVFTRAEQPPFVRESVHRFVRTSDACLPASGCVAHRREPALSVQRAPGPGHRSDRSWQARAFPAARTATARPIRTVTRSFIGGASSVSTMPPTLIASTM